MCIEPLNYILMYFFHKSVRRPFLFHQHLLKLLDGVLERLMLCLMLLKSRIFNLLLKLFLGGEMEVRIIRKIVHHLDCRGLLIALLAAVQ